MEYQTDLLVKDYLLADAIVPYTSIVCGIFMCKMAYDLTQLVSSVNIKSYPSLTKIQRTEWNNRGMSTTHAIFITVMSLYLVFFSDVFSDRLKEPITFRSSNISTFILGVSVGYFITDLTILIWLYPSMGGLEFVIHHSLSLCAVAYAMLTGEGQLYTYMVLISESTTPEINMRWFLDTAGMKRSAAYLFNGILLFFAWLVLVMHVFGCTLVFAVPAALFIMNMMWFLKILKGLKKTLAKRP